jgi:type III secretory pathway component EscT
MLLLFGMFLHQLIKIVVFLHIGNHHLIVRDVLDSINNQKRVFSIVFFNDSFAEAVVLNDCPLVAAVR